MVWSRFEVCIDRVQAAGAPVTLHRPIADSNPTCLEAPWFERFEG